MVPGREGEALSLPTPELGVLGEGGEIPIGRKDGDLILAFNGGCRVPIPDHGSAHSLYPEVKFSYNYATAGEEALRKPQCFGRVIVNAAAGEFGECDRERKGSKLPGRCEGESREVSGAAGEEGWPWTAHRVTLAPNSHSAGP